MGKLHGVNNDFSNNQGVISPSAMFRSLCAYLLKLKWRKPPAPKTIPAIRSRRKACQYVIVLNPKISGTVMFQRNWKNIGTKNTRVIARARTNGIMKLLGAGVRIIVPLPTMKMTIAPAARSGDGCKSARSLHLGRIVAHGNNAPAPSSGNNRRFFASIRMTAHFE